MSNNNSCMFKCKKKNSIDGKIYRVYQIMPLPNQFGPLGLVGIMYCEQDKKFDANDLSQFEIIDEISLQ